jgi:hypothetical protein
MKRERKLHPSKFGMIETPLFNILQGNGITSLEMLQSKTWDELLTLPHMGPVNKQLMLEFLQRENIKLRARKGAAVMPQRKPRKRKVKVTHIIITTCYDDGTQDEVRTVVE